MKRNLYVVAHRGLSSEAPENTYHSFDLAISKGFKYIEFDVQLTHDKEVVIIHDETIDRTSNGTGKVNDKNIDELSTYDFGSWFSSEFKQTMIPKFSKVLEKYQNVNFVVEIKGKENDLVEKVMENIKSHNFWKDKIYKSKNIEPKITFCSFLPEQLIKLRNYSDDIVVGFLVKIINQDIINFASSLKLDGIFPYYKLLTKENINKLENFKVSCWGFEKPEEVDRLIGLDIDGVTVDWADKI